MCLDLCSDEKSDEALGADLEQNAHHAEFGLSKSCLITLPAWELVRFGTAHPLYNPEYLFVSLCFLLNGASSVPRRVPGTEWALRNIF